MLVAEIDQKQNRREKKSSDQNIKQDVAIDKCLWFCGEININRQKLAAKEATD